MKKLRKSRKSWSVVEHQHCISSERVVERLACTIKQSNITKKSLKSIKRHTKVKVKKKSAYASAIFLFKLKDTTKQSGT